MKKLALAALTAATTATTVFAQGDNIMSIEKRLKALEEQNQELIDEIANLRQLVVIPELGQQQFSGLGYAASKVYFSPKGLSIGGYGEITYQNWGNSSKKDKTDTYRFIPYIGYKFTDKVILNSEIEFEHGANHERSGEITIEFLYIDFLINKWANLRVGNYLIPIGITNLMHEPIFFNSVNRPEVETKVIPSTWNENGIMLFSNTNNLDYHIGIVNGLHATSRGDEVAFSEGTWIRGGRQAGAKAIAENFAIVASLNYTGISGLYAGASFYRGNSGQGETDASGNKIDGTVTLLDVHVKYNWKGFEVVGLYTRGTLSDADKISTVNGQTIAEEVYGWYVNLSYDVYQLIDKGSNWSLPVFARYEKFDTHAKVPSGFTKNDELDKTVLTVGLNFKPHPNVVLKANYQFRDNAAGGEPDVFELGLGFIF